MVLVLTYIVLTAIGTRKHYRTSGFPLEGSHMTDIRSIIQKLTLREATIRKRGT